MAVSKEEMRKVVLAKQSDHTKLILGASAAVFALFIIFGLMNLNGQVDWSMKALPHEDINGDGVVNDRPLRHGHQRERSNRFG